MSLSFKRFSAAGAIVALASLPATAQELHPFADSSRLVSIGGSLTEIIYALGEEGKLIARDQTATYPEAAVALPDVGYMRQLAPEGVLSVSPSALLVIEGSGPPEALEVLSHAGVEYQTVPESFSHEGILVKVRAVGQALGVPDKAEAPATEIDTALKAVKQRTADITTRKRVLFVLSAEGGKIRASGTGTAADGIIAPAGAVNAIEEYSGYKALTEEAIIEAAPDVILMMDRGGDHSASNADLIANPAIALTEAGRNHAIIRLDGAYLLGFGPRTAEAVSDLVDALYGE
ncbi:ABC transporter substrate-binding protein [Devosia sp. A8/3-2]|nr:ABC transporter substrate-binding protein [Devosia sp. A8/3-2]